MISLEGKKVIYDRNWKTDSDGFASWRADTDWMDEKIENDDEAWRLYAEYIDEIIYDEKANLDIELDGYVLPYGYLGTWRGTFGGMPLPFPPKWSDASPSNLNCIFDVEDPYDGAVWYVAEEDGEEDVYFWRPEHDSISGTRFVFRLADPDFAEGVEEGEIEVGDEMWFRNHTSSLAPYVADVYGW